MASGWRQNGVRMRQDGVKQVSEVCQGSGVGVRRTLGCVRMRQEGIRVASGRRQDSSASGWRQDDVKRRGARINLLWFYVLTVSGLTHLPYIPNQLHFIQKSAHEVPEANWEARVMPALIEKSFILSICDSFFVLKPALSICSPSVIHWISKLFIDSIHILFLLYLLLWFGFPTSKPAGFHQHH